MSARAALLMREARDNETGIKIGPSHTELTEADKQRFDLQYDRLKASQERQADIRARPGLRRWPASVLVVTFVTAEVEVGCAG